jgi:hypothetical protein
LFVSVTRRIGGLQAERKVVQYILYGLRRGSAMGTGSKKSLKRLGKAQAREQFAPLVEGLSTVGGLVEITDYGKVAAVMLSYKDYLWLLAQANEPFKPKRQLAGSAVLTGDLEAASKEITASIFESLARSAREL